MLGTRNPKRRNLFGADDTTLELPAGSLPCRSCGVAVTAYADTPIETLTLYGQRNAHGFGADVHIAVTRCNRCADRREQAAAILRRHPAIARENGNVGIDRLDAALSALDLLGRTGRLAETLTVTDADVRALISAFAALGGWAAWSGGSAAPNVCASARWSRVPQIIREDTSSAFAGLLRRRLEVPKPFGPPSNRGALRGCGFCGLGTLLVKESDATAEWGPAVQIPLAAMGARGSETVLAHLCPTCGPSLTATGAIGLPAVWLAAIRFQGFEPRSIDSIVSIDGVRPWAVLRAAEPNSSPWSHINVTALAHELTYSTLVRSRTDATP